MGMIFLLAALTATMLLWPQLPAARWLHRTIIETPLDLIGKMERRHIIFALLALFLFQAYAMVATVDLATLVLWDLSLYVDLFITVWAIKLSAGVEGIKTWGKTKAASLVRAFRLPNRSRASRIRRKRPPANDDDHHHQFQYQHVGIALAA